MAVSERLDSQLHAPPMVSCRPQCRGDRIITCLSLLISFVGGEKMFF